MTRGRIRRMVGGFGLIAASLVAVGAAQLHTSAAVALTPQGSLIAFPNPALSWSVWYAGAIGPAHDNVLDVAPVGYTVSTENRATAQTTIPVSQLPTSPFNVTMRTTGSVVAGINWYSSTSALISTQNIPPATAEFGQSIFKTAAPITIPVGAVNAQITAVTVNQAFSLIDVSLDPVGVAPPSARELFFVDAGVADSYDIRTAPTMAVELNCGGAITRSRISTMGGTVIPTPGTSTSCTFDVVEPNTIEWTFGPGATRLPNNTVRFESPIVTRSGIAIGTGAGPGTLRVADPTNAFTSFAGSCTALTNEGTRIPVAVVGSDNIIFDPFGPGPTINPHVNGYGIRTDIFRTPGAGPNPDCRIFLYNVFANVTYRVNNGPVLTSRFNVFQGTVDTSVSVLDLTGFVPGQLNVVTLNPGGTPPGSTTTVPATTTTRPVTSTTIVTTTRPPTTATTTTVVPPSTTRPPSTTGPSTTRPVTTIVSTTVRPTTALPTSTLPSTTTNACSPAGNVVTTATPTDQIFGGPVTFNTTGLRPSLGRVDYSVNGIGVGSVFVTAQGDAPLAIRIYNDGPVLAVWVRWCNGIETRSESQTQVRIVSNVSTTSPTTTLPSTTTPPTTTPTTTRPATTIPPTGPTTRPTTTRPGSTSPPTTAPVTTLPPTTAPNATLTVSPSAVRAGGTVTLTISGLSPNQGRVDFGIGGIPVGSVAVDAAGTAKLTVQAWSSGEVRADWVRYQNGVPQTSTYTSSLRFT